MRSSRYIVVVFLSLIGAKRCLDYEVHKGWHAACIEKLTVETDSYPVCGPARSTREEAEQDLTKHQLTNHNGSSDGMILGPDDPLDCAIETEKFTEHRSVFLKALGIH